jgi:pimeloyl-ACP methyl ester carboxylesterase
MSSLRGTEPGKAGNWAEKIVLGETSSGVFARGSDIRNPVLLILAGGPGGTETGWFRKYNSVLEEHFTMVHWEQRGAGKSFRLLFTDRRHMTRSSTSMTVLRCLSRQLTIRALRRRIGSTGS